MKRLQLWRRLLFAPLAVTLLGVIAWHCGPPSNEPEEYQQFEEDGGTDFSVYTSAGCRRAVPTSGDNHPIITWGNGTSGSPSTYSGLLNHWASHGFITVASVSGSTGSGYQIRECLEDAKNLSTAHASLFAAAGHWDGACGALNAAEFDPSIDTTTPIQPNLTAGCNAWNQTAPMMCLGGANDQPQGCYQLFQESNVPTFEAIREDASINEPTGTGTNHFTGITTAWFVYQLKPDNPNHDDAASLFHGPDCGICEWDVWTVRQKYDP